MCGREEDHLEEQGDRIQALKAWESGGKSLQLAVRVLDRGWISCGRIRWENVWDVRFK